MAVLVDGMYLEQYLDPQLLQEFRDFNDDFIGVLKRANPKAAKKEGIHFNKLINNVGFHVNRRGGFTSKKMAGKKGFVPYDKLDTDPTEVSDDEMRGLVFDKDAEARVKHRESWQIGVRDYAMHKLAPSQNVDGKMPVMRTTGATINGRKRMTYSDLISFLILVDSLNLMNKMSFHMILNSEHRGDLWLDRASTNNYRDIKLDTETGIIKSLGKIKFFENNTCPIYDSTGLLKSLGAEKETAQGDQEGSIFFYGDNTTYHIESVESLYKPRKQDTNSENPASTFRLHTYGLCDKVQEHGFGAIVSDNVIP